MGAEVYVDLYFLINMSMDFLCLLIAGRLLHRRMRTVRLLLASALGGAYAVAALLLFGNGFWGFLTDLTAACVMCAVAFWERRLGWRRMLSAIAVFGLISMALGGIMTAFYSLLNRLDLPFEVLDTDTLSVWLFGLLALVAGLLTVRGGRWMGVAQKTEWVQLHAVLLGRSVELCAMVDTANLLTDPVSGRGVIAVDRQKLAHVLPQELLGEGAEGERAVFDYIRSSPSAASRIRLIPAQTATGGGMLVAILPDQLTVTEGKQTYRADYLIGISSLGAHTHGFDALIPRA